ncbi:MAG: 50S ribosomal protein L6 [Parcubacteria group bacterium GW2011_GWC2_45_7]|nr:MAG: 50S ribosomal protein L6 [Parcubacteria group bacterium GW2011_GWC2_45_7]KKU73523.1 MAG: 50S ribosomal protein L6 [Parcubacteria group bacterium GW2011_GWA2_47_26]
MSRIGKKNIIIPKGVTVQIAENTVTVQGPKGQDVLVMHPSVKVEEAESVLAVSVKNPDEKQDRALWGLHRALLANIIQGVTRGFEKKLEMIGVGYKAALKDKSLVLELGFSHPVEVVLPEGISCTVEKNIITLSGINKQLVGEIAAQIRRLRKPEPYKGKGIRYAGEFVRRKAGKATKTAGAK